ncbi:hypothetical protein WOLCODRAFT_76746 [Wolfiporia cocos MD-104 SS10]|uniref:Uncharacterized protein n=1 Tax=Wolfiporia cocos (strain MD-104) TaxID=742152 RepID=A0A2H3JPG0_WOLCO|nr:hypothetical protein WOLCODRAFT_76746 [Wolfiporia cocos MD-104 SS10]
MEGVSHDFGSSTQTLGSKSRTTASSVLWGHLLTKGSSASSIQRTSQGSSASSLAPIAPMDKAGTSLRVLLHDTQATLEKFSSRVDALTGGVDQSRREIMTVQKLFQQDREKMVDETVDLVNRCQREIQKAVGSPAQVSRVDEIHAELVAVDRRLETLDKRIDMLQMVWSCHMHCFVL